MVKTRKIKAKTLVVMGFLLLFAITYVYGRSVTAVYAFIELSIAVMCYFGFIKYFYCLDRVLRILCLTVVMFAWLAGMVNGDLKSTLLITVPLIMPLYISTLNIEYKYNGKDFRLVTWLAVIIMYFTIIKSFFGNFNSNTIGFVGFMGVSFGFVWIKCAKSKLVPMLSILAGIIIVAYSGSRNVAVVSFICLLLILLPKRIVNKPVIYISICTIILVYTVFAADIMEWGFANPKINNFLVEFTSNYSKKAWEMSARADYLKLIHTRIAQRGIITQLFGEGVLTIHGHNMFYQCVLEFGYFGTLFIYLMFVRIFKLAYVLIRENHDDIVLGCVIALWGNLILQGADVYLLGPETYALIPQILMGIILQRYMSFRKSYCNP